MDFDGPEYPKEGFCNCGNLIMLFNSNEGHCCECLLKLVRLETKKFIEEKLDF